MRLLTSSAASVGSASVLASVSGSRQLLSRCAPHQLLQYMLRNPADVCTGLAQQACLPASSQRVAPASCPSKPMIVTEAATCNWACSVPVLQLVADGTADWTRLPGIELPLRKKKDHAGQSCRLMQLPAHQRWTTPLTAGRDHLLLLEPALLTMPAHCAGWGGNWCSCHRTCWRC